MLSFTKQKGKKERTMKRTIIAIVCVLMVACLGFVIFITVQDKGQSSSAESTVGNQSSIENQEPEYSGEEENYLASDTVLSFSTDDKDKIILEPNFDVSLYTQSAGTAISPYQFFASGMCLQRDAINRIWGDAKNAEHIAVEIKGNVYYGNVVNGKFEVYLPKMQAGGPYDLTFITEAGRKVLSNVYIGEVFLLSGQSNMEFQPQHAGDVLKDLYSTSACVNDQIRMLQIGWLTPNAPTTDVMNYCQWQSANQSTIPNFTAVGYIFGKQMQEELNCPVGLISNPVGGSSIEFWLSEANYNKVQESYATYTDGTTILTPCLGYNGMLYPLTGLNVRGVVWYQGESNAFGTEEYYDIALEIFMKQCRDMFNNEQLAFTLCELARYEGNPYAYSIVNERINYVAQKDDYSVVARNLDLGDWYDIHPKDKREIGRRTAYETLRNFFNKQKEAPVTIDRYTFNEDGSVSIELSCEADIVNGSNGFEVYVNGKYTYTCDAQISGKTLTLTANGTITKVRYGYTCKMTEAVKNDVSKMVTVYDKNGFPLDLFMIANPLAGDANLPDAPSLSAGYCDSGYQISVEEQSGAYVIDKKASAGQWTAAMLTVADYNSAYDLLSIKLTTENVKNLTIQLTVGGVSASGSPYTMYIVLYQANVSDGEHEINVDLNNIAMLNESWQVIPNSSVKDYEIKTIAFSLDTAVEVTSLVKQDSSCTVSDVTFKASKN